MASGPFLLHPPVQLLPAVVCRWGHFQGSADVNDGLTLVQELLSSAKLADNQFGAMAFDFHGASLCQAASLCVV